jgi:NADPH-dependent ferric siderophore reductase
VASESRTEISLPEIERFRLESKRRFLTVKKKTLLTPHMMRIVLYGSDLQGFHSPSPDDHVKVFFPCADGLGKNGRDYTPRLFDPERLELTIDFVLHAGGLGAEWARAAALGDELEIGGPRGSTVVHAPDAWWLLIGDETALPSIGRRLESMAKGTHAYCVLAVTGLDGQLTFESPAELEVEWVHRPINEARKAEALLSRLTELKLPAGNGFVWIAAESAVSRALREEVIGRMRWSEAWVKAASYWTAQDAPSLLEEVS